MSAILGAGAKPESATAGFKPEMKAATASHVAPAASAVAKPVISAKVLMAQRRAVLLKILAPIAGFALFALIWQLIAQTSGQIPTPAKVWDAAVAIYSDPFYSKGPNDQGIGWNILNSVGRVCVGFGLAALIGIDRKSVV